MVETGAIQYVEQELRPSVVADIVRVAEYHARRHAEDHGHFSVPRDVFCYVDHLGGLAFGDSSSTTRAVKFIRAFFPARYHDLAELTYAMWRHGTVHTYRPISYRAPLPGSVRTVEVRWLSTNHNRKRERLLHMLAYPIDGNPDAVFLVMNSCQLAFDLLAAIDAFASRLRKDSALESECDKRVAAFGAIRDHTEIRGQARQTAVAAEIGKAWAARAGCIDGSGNLITPHP